VVAAAAVLPTGRDVVFDTEDGIRLGAWYFRRAGEAVLVRHGNAGDRDDIVPLSLSRRPYDAAVESKRLVVILVR
jgi:fermentation-respiration switch protein FrsA (DUF1100 family)